MTITKYVTDWLSRADEDILIAELAIKNDGPPNLICFHAQQAAEKCLKAFLSYREFTVRKVHDLPTLIVDCAKFDAEFLEFKENAIYLTQFYIETRYPGDMPIFNINEARKALNGALDIKKFVLSKIK